MKKLLKHWLFNPLTRKTLVTVESTSSLNKRFQVPIRDLAFIACMGLPVVVITAVISVMITIIFYNDHKPAGLNQIMMLAALLVVDMLLINKDFFNGRSVGKRMMGRQIVNAKDGSPATRTQCVIRNLTLVLTLVELLCMVANSERRLGDRLAGTKIVEAPVIDPETTILPEIDELQFDFDLLKTLIVSAVVASVHLAIFIVSDSTRQM